MLLLISSVEPNAGGYVSNESTIYLYSISAVDNKALRKPCSSINTLSTLFCQSNLLDIVELVGLANSLYS